MFRKIVSNLPFQPELLEQAVLYVHKLKKEDNIRRIGFLLLLTGLFLQLFIMAFPPTASIAANRADIIYGATSKEAILDSYRKNQDQLGRNDIQEIYNYYGIGESQIMNSYKIVIKDNETSYINTSRADTQWADSFIPISGAAGGGIYEFPLDYWNKERFSDGYPALTGITTYGYRFWILLKGSGSIVYEQGAKKPNLEIKKDLVSSYESTEGNQVKYSIRFRNNGPVSANSVKISDTLPSQLSYLSFTSSLDLDLKSTGNMLEWTPKEQNQALDSGSNWHEIALVLQAKNPTSKICNQATIGAINSNKITSSKNSGCTTVKAQTCPGTGLPVPKAGIESCKITCPNGSQVLYSETCATPMTICKNIETIKTDGSLKRSFVVSLYGQPGSEVKYVSLFVDNQEVAQSSNEIKANKYKLDYEFSKQGNFSVRAQVATVNGNSPETEQCNVVENIISSKEQEVSLIKNSRVSNITQSIDDANNTTAAPGDVLKYVLSIKNSGNITASNISLSGEYAEDVNDILEYADITNIGDGELDEHSGKLSWPATTIKPGSIIYKEFVVKVKDNLPATPVSASNPLSYDYSMHSKYGRTILINLPKSPSKIIEQVLTSLPNTAKHTTIIACVLLATIAGYFYYRNKLLVKELVLITKEFLNGY